MKKVLVTACLLVLVVCLVATSAVQVDARTTDYQVGFARVDINPYIVDGDYSSGLMELPLRGVGDGFNRLSQTKLIDDNGDGKIDSNDGLSATCVAITDYEGNTILMITIDLLGGDKSDLIKNEICARVEAALASGELTNVKLTADQIYYAGTHSHNAPDISLYSASGRTGYNDEGKSIAEINANLGLWIDRMVKHVGDAAILALKDRAYATVTQHSISAAKDTRMPVKGKVMNSVRHYYNYDSSGSLVCVGGDNFNDRGSNPKQVTPVDDTLYMLRFDFSEHNSKTGQNNLPIVVANWRGHPSLNNSDVYYGSRTALSSDYPNAFRHALEYNCTVSNDGLGYYSDTQVNRVAFFQGAGGNVNPRGREKVSGGTAADWIDNMSIANKEPRGNGYGRILCAMAKHGLATGQTLTPGKIGTVHYTYTAERKTTGITAVSYEAGKAYQALENPKNPFVYTSASGETFVIGSKYHANAVVSRWDPTLQKAADGPASLSLNAIMLGNDFAMVTVPGEPFDYYYNEDGSNAWNNLINEATYGKPWVLSLCNGCSGYVPNNKAYVYDEGSTRWATGSYESHTTPYAQGTGEKMIQLFSIMLNTLEKGQSLSYDAPCQHCGETVTWQAYTNQSSLDTGHYYLFMDAFAPQIIINPEQQVCFDLNGHTVKGTTRAFFTRANGNSVLNIMDSSEEQTGLILGSGTAIGAAYGFGGGAILVDSKNTCNLYGGTVGMCDRPVYSVSSGGVVYVIGTFNMYGGTILGGRSYSFTGSYTKESKVSEANRSASGATMYVSGTFNMYGGRVKNGESMHIDGTVTKNEAGKNVYSQILSPGKQTGTCIYNVGKVTLAGDAVIEDLYFTSSASKLLKIDTANGPFTGKVNLSYGKITSDTLVFGTCASDADIPEDAITFSRNNLSFRVENGKLYANTAAVLVNEDGAYTYFATAAEAIAACNEAPETTYVRLTADVEENISVTADMILNLNGCSVSGDIQVADGATLYCLDSKTDDYSVSDGIYGRLTGKITGKVEGKPSFLPGDTKGAYPLSGRQYVLVKEGEEISFHRILTDLSKVTLRPSQAGIYYTASFGSDEILASMVEEFGIVVNAYRAPDKEASLTEGGNICIRYSGEEWTRTSLTSAMVANIMEEDNTLLVNMENAKTPVYGCAYVRLSDGTCLYSRTVSYSLQQLTEAADEANAIKGKGLEQLMAMYDLYASVMEGWRLPRFFVTLAG